MAHTGSTFAPNAALGNGVPSLATVKASIDARRPQGCRAGAAAAPAPAPPPSPAICMAAPKRRSAAGGGAARRSRWPGVQTAGAASTGATRAASAWHANVAFAPRRTRQHAWNLHQHCTLAQVPLIDLKSILLKNFAKRI